MFNRKKKLESYVYWGWAQGLRDGYWECAAGERSYSTYDLDTLFRGNRYQRARKVAYKEAKRIAAEQMKKLLERREIEDDKKRTLTHVWKPDSSSVPTSVWTLAYAEAQR